MLGTFVINMSAASRALITERKWSYPNVVLSAQGVVTMRRSSELQSLYGREIGSLTEEKI
jgi:hypothetical protein